ncbi:hypothetical protein [Streptomyces sp. NBC_01477]|uniref:hypothetical protein n=1 Tax=Streptomyces sp. NBC_01477 TaxID=2976015 RepID=UPI002E33F151|nr:hypothetical protein [Streptomyces sp. NBC_01477]
MTLLTPAGPGRSAAASLAGQAEAAGLRVLAAAAWPESAADRVPPPLAGFVVSSFSPLAAETARRCLARRPAAAAAVTAVIVVSPLGDLAGAVHVAGVVEGGGRPGPLLFFQAVPNAVAGHVAARWELTGPVVCVGDTGAGLDVAALLLEDGDADEALLVRVDQAATAAARDRAGAVLLGAGPQESDARPGSGPHDSEGAQP